MAAEALNGTIVQPGEEFSFNQAVGQRTAEKGYQKQLTAAACYEIGGGVCQISSTLYRAAFNAGMEITFRRSHP
ncbi:MAG: VanW family protein [Clostridium sp.]